MKSVYEASTSLDAHMILGLLNQKGVEGRIDGEFLQGGVGDLQAINIVRVLVDENNYSKARKIIESWESSQTNDTPIESGSRNSASGLIKFLAGILIGGGIMYLMYNHPIETDGIDYDGDGILDEKWTYKDNRPSKTEIDRNFDGKLDLIYFYDLKGWVKESKADDNFDGVFETRYTYKNGDIVRGYSDLNNDGKIDYITNYKHGVLSRAEIRGEGISSAVKQQTFEMGKLISSKFNSDGDGIFEQQIEYDYFEAPTITPIN